MNFVRVNGPLAEDITTETSKIHKTFTVVLKRNEDILHWNHAQNNEPIFMIHSSCHALILAETITTETKYQNEYQLLINQITIQRH